MPVARPRAPDPPRERGVLSEGTRVVAARELRVRVRDPAFLLSNVFFVLVLAAGAVVGVTRSGSDDPKEHAVGVVGDDARRLAALAEEQGSLFGVKLKVRDTRRAAAARQLEEEELDVVIVGRDGLLVKRQLDDDLGAALQSSFRLLLARAPPRSVQASLPVAKVAPDVDPGELVAVLSAPLLLVFIYGYGFFIASAIVEEKASRVVELVLGAVSASELLAGKVLALGVLGVAQLVLVVVLGGAAALVAGLGLSAAAGGALLATLVWFVLGFLLFGSLFAVAGSLVSRQEDLGYTQLPVLVVLLVIFAPAMLQVSDPGSSVARVLSLLPPFAPLVMPLRVGYEEATVPEFAVAALLTAAAGAALIRVAARFHRNSILRLGPRLALREAFGDR